MRRSDTFRGDSRANRDDATMARGIGKGKRGQRKRKGHDDIEKEIRIERQNEKEGKQI